MESSFHSRRDGGAPRRRPWALIPERLCLDGQWKRGRKTIEYGGLFEQPNLAIPGAGEALKWARRGGLPIRFVTNTATRSAKAIREGMVRLGFALEQHELVTAPLAAQSWIKERGLRPHALVHPAIADVFDGLGAGPPDCVVLGDAREGLTYDALNQALRTVAYGGTVVAGAFPGVYPAGLDFGAEAHYNRIKIVFSRSCSEPNPDYPNWNESRLVDVAWRLLTRGQINAAAIVQPVVGFEDLAQAYPRIATDPVNYLKLGAKFS